MSAVLLVDDDDAFSLLVAHAIRRSGLQIELHSVFDGDEAVQYLGQEGKYADSTAYPFPSLVLLDLKMPRMNGFEVLEWKRTQPQLDSLPVAIWSSSGLAADKERALGLGAVAFFEKPLRTEGFIELLNNLSVYYQLVPSAAA